MAKIELIEKFIEHTADKSVLDKKVLELLKNTEAEQWQYVQLLEKIVRDEKVVMPGTVRYLTQFVQNNKDADEIKNAARFANLANFRAVAEAYPRIDFDKPFERRDDSFSFIYTMRNVQTSEQIIAKMPVLFEYFYDFGQSLYSRGPYGSTFSLEESVEYNHVHRDVADKIKEYSAKQKPYYSDWYKQAHAAKYPSANDAEGELRKAVVTALNAQGMNKKMVEGVIEDVMWLYERRGTQEQAKNWRDLCEKVGVAKAIGRQNG